MQKEQVTPLRPEAARKEAAPEARSGSGRDLARIAIFISVLAVILLTVFFFGLNKSISGLSEEVRALGAVRERLAGVEERVTALEDLPRQTRRMVLSGMLQEMSQRAAYVHSQLQDAEGKAQMATAMESLSEVQTALAD
jgi:hypothetical protein